MSLGLRQPAPGEETAVITVALTGTPEQIDAAARDITQVCDRVGARFTIERRRSSDEEEELFPGEHRSLR